MFYKYFINNKKTIKKKKKEININFNRIQKNRYINLKIYIYYKHNFLHKLHNKIHLYNYELGNIKEIKHHYIILNQLVFKKKIFLNTLHYHEYASTINHFFN